MAFAVTFSPMHNTREIMTDASIAERDLIRDAKTTAISTLVAKKGTAYCVYCIPDADALRQDRSPDVALNHDAAQNHCHRFLAQQGRLCGCWQPSDSGCGRNQT